MYKKFINSVLDKMSNELDLDKNLDVITELFISRDDELHDMFMKSKEYKVIKEKLDKLSKEITKKYENSIDILTAFEDYSDLVDSKSYACEKLMYRLGVSDALILILEIAGKIDIDKFIKENI